MIKIENGIAHNAIFGEGTYTIVIEHNEDGEPLTFEIPCGIVPISAFTSPDNSLTELLFLAMRDFQAEYGDAEYGYVRKIEAGKFYTKEFSYAEDHQEDKYELYQLVFTFVKSMEYWENEWMEGMCARHLITPPDYSR